MLTLSWLQVDSPAIQWGPMSAWTVIGFSMALMALVEYMRRHFVSKEKADAQFLLVCNKIDELRRDLEKMDSHITFSNTRNESTFVSRLELNGVTSRMDVFQRELAETTAESRAAFVLANQVSTDIRHLTTRFTDLLRPIDEKLEMLYKWKMLEHRSLRDDEKQGGV